MRRTKKFRPTGLDYLEARTVLNAASVVQAAASQADLGGAGQGQGQQQTLATVDQVINQVNQAFANFATQYYAAEASAFAGTGNGGTNPADLGATTTQLANALAQQVAGAATAAPGGAGMLPIYLQLRLAGNATGSLESDLNSIPMPGTGGLTRADHSLLAQGAIARALLSTQNFLRLYDVTLLQTAEGFFSGAFHFAAQQQSQSGGGGGQSGGVQTGAGGNLGQNSGQGGVVEQVINQVNLAFTGYATNFYRAEAAYLNGLGGGSSSGTTIGATDYNNMVTQSVNTLQKQVGDVLNSVPGGAGILSAFVQARLGTAVPGSLGQDLTSLPAPGSSSLSREGFMLASQKAIASALLDTQTFVRLYDATISAAVNGFFNAGIQAHANRFGFLTRAAILRQLRGGGSGGVAAQSTSGDGLGGGQVSTRQFNDGTTVSFPGGTIGTGGSIVSQPSVGFGGVPTSTFLSPSFGFFPPTFNPGFGFGGLGNGFNMGFGAFNGTQFGNGFGFGSTLFPGFGGGFTFNPNLGLGNGFVAQGFGFPGATGPGFGSIIF